MALPNSYTQKPNTVSDYFEAILNAEPPERFTNQFLVQLDFKSTNDRMFIGILKELGFIDTDGAPKQRYYDFLDRTQSKIILAEGIKEAFSDLFNVNKNAQEMSAEDVKNKLRTLYAGSKKDDIITKISKTFTALCEYADFTSHIKKPKIAKEDEISKDSPAQPKVEEINENKNPKLSLKTLQYHINIVLPESRDQAVYDAIFKSLKDHLG